MRILFLALISFFAFSDNHDEMYEEVYASYLYCSVDERLTEDEATTMWEKWFPAFKKHAEMLDDNVSAVMLFPLNTNEEMRGGDDMFFVTHAPTMKELGKFQMDLYNMLESDKEMPDSPMVCDNRSEAFQRVGPGTSDEPYDFFTVDYWPCKYKDGADPVAMRKAQAEFSMEHYANGAEGGYRYIYPSAGSPRGETPDFWISAAHPGLEARGAAIDIYWDKSYGTEAERERWNHMICDTPSTWVGYQVHN